MAKQQIHGKTNFKQGYYKPNNPDKYIGTLEDIIYRSSWEQKFMVWCDINVNILKWSSEPIKIPYYNPIDKKIHFYIADFWVKMKDKIALVEIKPLKQTVRPNLKQGQKTLKEMKNYNYEIQTYIKNVSKWKSAQEFCEKQGWEFIRLTEKDLKI